MAGLLSGRIDVRNRKVGVIINGGNIDRGEFLDDSNRLIWLIGLGAIVFADKYCFKECLKDGLKES